MATTITSGRARGEAGSGPACLRARSVRIHVIHACIDEARLANMSSDAAASLSPG